MAAGAQAGSGFGRQHAGAQSNRSQHGTASIVNAHLIAVAVQREAELAKRTQRYYGGLLGISKADATIRALKQNIPVVQFGWPQFSGANLKAPITFLLKGNTLARTKWIEAESVTPFHLLNIDRNDFRHKGPFKLGAQAAGLLGRAPHAKYECRRA